MFTCNSRKSKKKADWWLLESAVKEGNQWKRDGRELLPVMKILYIMIT